MQRNEKYQKLIETCELALREGHAGRISALVKSQNLKRMPREWRLPLANICRRASLLSTGLKVLHPIVHQLAPSEPPTAHELAEYAVLLHKAGVPEDALKVLDKVDARQVPRALMYRAFCHFSRWEYQTATPYLQEYLKTEDSGYEGMIARVNLGAAFVYSRRLTEAIDLLSENIGRTSGRSEFSRLRANSLELRAQALIGARQISQARLDLEAAHEILGVEATSDQLMVQKGLAICAALEQNSAGPIDQFRKLAEQRHHWESVRDADLWRLVLEFNETRFETLYFGSPYGAYRARVETMLGRKPQRESFVLGSRRAPCLDLFSGELDGEPIFNSGKKSHQVIQLLFSDIYKPMRFHALFSALFAGERFDIFTSPDRVHKIIQRCRADIAEQRLPLTIERDKEYCVARAGEGLAIKIPLHWKPSSSEEIQLLKLARVFSLKDKFTAAEAREELDLSLTGFQRLAQWAVGEGKLIKLGQGPSTAYKIAA